MGQLEHGLYIDDCDHIHPDVINQYHIHEQVAADEQGWEDEEIAAHLEQDQESNFHHAAVRVPRRIDPFKDAPDSFSVFEETLQHVRNEGHMPIGYGLHPDEWETDEYPSFEHIRSGRHAHKELRIALPDMIWRPRAILWGQALDIMDRMFAMLDEQQAELGE